MVKAPGVRNVAEHLSHRLVLRRRMPPPFGRTRLYVCSEGGLKYLRPRLTEIDPMLTSLADELVRPGDVIWDIGANVGLFTFAAATAATRTGKVLAVEPDTWLVNLIRRSLRIPNDRARIDVLPAAVGSAVGISRFCVASRSRATNHLDGFGSSQTGGVRAVETVPTFTLDSLLGHFSAPDVVKIDVEGAEHAVFSGAEEILSRVRPAVICEVMESNSRRVTETLHRWDYRILDATEPPEHRRSLAAAPVSTLAVPVERG
ncbi:FkbM family methyltransferase [Frankia sp. Mgl5]|uniref:FkbM family methyltransferase n=1 Tax=Frankia sp. Mgl5 TaxID=2933793 RepID=UPI00200EE806|nr:FkbM family methyltransferase [Frankia sp. Mgl5]MCK9931849.1 FkbM family methyltransferase [Frankia sp. Mgl5]